ncbi:MAG: hypothetical protein ACOY3L_18360 [Pseudomonadota bacterium]
MTGKDGRRLGAAIGLVLTLAWLALCWIYVDRDIGWDNTQSMLPHELGAAIAGVVAPLVFLWLVLLNLTRGRELAEATDAINRQLDRLAFPSEVAAEKVESAGAALKRQAEALKAVSDESAGLLAGLAERFQGEAGALAEAVRQARAETDRIREGLALELEAAREVASKLDAERLHWQEVVRRHGDTVSSAAGAAADQIAREMERRTDEIDAAVTRALEQGTSMAAEIKMQEEQLGQAVDSAIDRFGQAMARLVRELAQAGDRTAERGGELVATLERQMGELGRTADDASARLKADIGASAGELTQSLTRLADDIEARLAAADRQTRQISEAVRAAGAAGTEFERVLAERAAALTRTGETATAQADAAGQALGRLADETALAMQRPFEAALANLRTIAAETSANAKALAGDLAHQAEDVRARSAAAQDEAAALGTALARQMEEVAAATERLKADGEASAAALRAELEQALAAFRRTGEGLLADLAIGARNEGEEMRRQLAAASASFAAEAKALLESVGAETDRVGQQWREATEEAQRLRRGLADQAAGLEASSVEAGERMEASLRQAEARLADYRRSAETMLEKIDTMIVAGRDQADRIGATAADGAGKIETAGRLFSDQAARLAAVATGAFAAQQQAREAIGKLSEALGDATSTGAERIGELERIVGTLKGDLASAADEASRNSRAIAETFRGDTERLVGMARRAAMQVAAVRGVVKDQLAELGQLSTQVGQLVDTIRDSLRGQAESFAAVAAGARADTAAIRGELESQVQTLTQIADQVAERLDRMGGTLDGRAEKLVEATDYVARRSTEIGATFGERAQFLTETVDRIGSQVSELAQRFDQQSQQLLRSTAAAEDQVQNLKRMQENVTRDLFLRAAAVMVEELNSLALDMDKLLETDVPDDVWRDYHKGDRSIFARRLFRTKDSYLVPAIEQRYKDDDRFRDLVTRYLDRFEELLAQAQEADPESVLNAAFITADVGKLYLLLSRSVGRGAAH